MDLAPVVDIVLAIASAVGSPDPGAGQVFPGGCGVGDIGEGIGELGGEDVDEAFVAGVALAIGGR